MLNELIVKLAVRSIHEEHIMTVIEQIRENRRSDEFVITAYLRFIFRFVITTQDSQVLLIWQIPFDIKQLGISSDKYIDYVDIFPLLSHRAIPRK